MSICALLHPWLGGKLTIVNMVAKISKSSPAYTANGWVSNVLIYQFALGCITC
jgi:hypothetical protein